MRKDVSKVLTECYKEGCKNGTPQYPRYHEAKLFDEVGGKVGIRHVHVRTPGHATKSFGENLGYLAGFLRKNIGRKWDDIYSEICANMDRRSATQEHIFQHLFDEFIPANEIRIVDGEPYIFSPGAPLYPVGAHRYRWRELWVDPRDGILKRASKLPKEKTRFEKLYDAERARCRVINQFTELHQDDKGLWYVFTIKPVPAKVMVYMFHEQEPQRLLGSVWTETEKAWSAWYHRKKDFERLPYEVRKRLGVPTLMQPEYEKANTDIILSRNQSRLVYGGQKYYYAKKRSASKKDLRAAGLKG